MDILVQNRREGIQMVRQKEVKKSGKHLANIFLNKGEFLWELNIKTMFLKPIAFDESIVNLDGKVSHKYEEKEDCLYTNAINVKNAERKFLKQLG